MHINNLVEQVKPTTKWGKFWWAFADIMFGFKCPNCDVRGSMGTRDYRYTRGYNNLCRQAASDPGRYCNNCKCVIWDKTDAQYSAECKKYAPWVTPTFERKRAMEAAKRLK